nr:chromate transporter [Bacillus sp. B15-48]
MFYTFLMIGFVSFGGGYAMIPVIEMEVSKHGWMTTQELTDVIAIAGMSPGPIATNSAVIVGYTTAGLLGAVVSALGMVLPSLFLILLIATFFYRFSSNQTVQSMFYGLRPVVTGLIIYAAIKFALTNDVLSFTPSLHMGSLLVIFTLSLFALTKLNWHPVFVIILSGLVGVALYS